MSVESIGDAFALGWRVTVRCSYGRSDGPRSQSSRECNYRKELDMETLVWTRGRAFPLSRLESRLRCPRCGSRNVVVLYRPPSSAAAGLVPGITIPRRQ
jgi:DNA-directed RNA polymerase subunit RPC12/RpoP